VRSTVSRQGSAPHLPPRPPTSEPHRCAPRSPGEAGEAHGPPGPRCPGRSRLGVARGYGRGPLGARGGPTASRGRCSGRSSPARASGTTPRSHGTVPRRGGSRVRASVIRTPPRSGARGRSGAAMGRSRCRGRAAMTTPDGAARPNPPFLPGPDAPRAVSIPGPSRARRTTGGRAGTGDRRPTPRRRRRSGAHSRRRVQAATRASGAGAERSGRARPGKPADPRRAA
jgi:hypothetical protein